MFFYYHRTHTGFRLSFLFLKIDGEKKQQTKGSTITVGFSVVEQSELQNIQTDLKVVRIIPDQAPPSHKGSATCLFQQELEELEFPVLT